jgi:hypothetical protein
MHGELTKEGRIAQRLEHGTFELALQVDLSARAVAEAQPDGEFAAILRLKDVVVP